MLEESEYRKTTTTTIQSCYHQCTKCGIIYKCGRNNCQMQFLYDVCDMCRKRRFYFNP
jgi:hypothetical protein